MAIVKPVQHPRTSDPYEYDLFFRQLVERLSYQTYAGDPSSHVTPRWINDLCLDTANGDWFMANGLTNSSWEQITYASGIMGDHGTLTGLADDDHTQYLKEKASGGAAAEVPAHTHADANNAGTVDHGVITGLSDDDHTQYLKEKGSGGTASETPTHTHADANNCGTVDHGALTGLADDDHTQYALEAISWTNVSSFLNSWVDYGSPYQATGYTKDGFSFVHLRGVVKDGSIGNPAFTLPVGYRPSADYLFPSVQYNGSAVLAGWVIVQSDGDVIPGGGANGWCSLDGVIFHV